MVGFVQDLRSARAVVLVVRESGDNLFDGVRLCSHDEIPFGLEVAQLELGVGLNAVVDLGGEFVEQGVDSCRDGREEFAISFGQRASGMDVLVADVVQLPHPVQR